MWSERRVTGEGDERQSSSLSGVGVGVLHVGGEKSVSGTCFSICLESGSSSAEAFRNAFTCLQVTD